MPPRRSFRRSSHVAWTIATHCCSASATDYFDAVQSVQNAAARLVTGARRCDHITPVLWQLHWLPVRQRVVFNIAGLVYISRLVDWLPRTSQTVAFCRTLAVAHCGPIPMTRGSCLCHEHITNSVIVVSRPPVLDFGTTFHLDSGGRDLPSTLSDNL